MNKKWLAIGFVFICLILMGAIWGSCWQYRQVEIDNLKIRVLEVRGEQLQSEDSAEYWRLEFENKANEWHVLQQNYFDLLDYSSNQTAVITVLYDKYQDLLRNPIIKEVIIDRYPTWENFESIEQVEFMFKGGITPLVPNVCLDIATDLQQSALNQGFKVSIALSRNGYYYGVRVTDTSGGQAGLLLQVGNSWYFVDPINWRMTKLW